MEEIIKTPRTSQALGITLKACGRLGPEHLPLAEVAQKLEQENIKLRAFAQGIMEAWPSGELNGGDLQDLAEKNGLLSHEIRYDACGEVCLCDKYFAPNEWSRGAVCYRKTPLLLGADPLQEDIKMKSAGNEALENPARRKKA
jgi:predicted small lipoprotein YifL